MLGRAGRHLISGREFGPDLIDQRLSLCDLGLGLCQLPGLALGGPAVHGPALVSSKLNPVRNAFVFGSFRWCAIAWLHRRSPALLTCTGYRVL
jgi:hypothetical protein